MKRLLVLLIAVFFLVGCAGASLSRTTTKDGATTLTLENYVLTESIIADGKVIAQNTMAPADQFVKDFVDKFVDAFKAIIGLSAVPVDAAKTVIPAVVK